MLPTSLFEHLTKKKGFFAKQTRQNKGMVMRSAEYARLAYFKAFIRRALPFPSLLRKTSISAQPASNIPPPLPPPPPDLSSEIRRPVTGLRARQLNRSGDARYTNHRQITPLLCLYSLDIPRTTRAQLRVNTLVVLLIVLIAAT